jgi:hypothetical protein
MDLFLEKRVNDLAATAQGQWDAQLYAAALDTWRAALADVESALALDPANATALRLRGQLQQALERVPPAPTPATSQAQAGSVEPPAFPLIKEGDAALFEIGQAHGGYLPDPELLSILDAKPQPPKFDYLPIVAAIVAIGFLAIAIRVISYYGAPHRVLSNAPLESHVQFVPSPLPPPDPHAGPPDDTLYFPDPGVTLPLLRAKFQPKADPAADGKVVLLAVIDLTGKPVEAKIIRGLDASHNVAAIRASEQWRFQPGTKDGRPVPVLAQIEISFHPQQ